MADPLRGVGPTSQTGGISGFISTLKEGILESKIGQLFCKILGLESKTTSKISQMTTESKEALHVARDSSNSPPPPSTNFRAQATHTATTQQIVHKSVGQQFSESKDAVMKLHRDVKDTIDKSSSGGSETKLPALRGYQEKATELLGKLNKLERQAEKEGMTLSPSELRNLNAMLKDAQKLTREKIIEIDNAKTNANVLLDHEEKYANFKPNKEPLAPSQKPAGKIDWGSWTGDKFQTRYKEFMANDLAGLTHDEIQHVHDVAGNLFNNWMAASSQGSTPDEASRQVGATPQQCLELRDLCNVHLRGDTAPAA